MILSTVQPNLGNNCSAESNGTCKDESMIDKNSDSSNETAVQINNLHYKGEHNDNAFVSEYVIEENATNKIYPSSPPPPPPPSTCNSLSAKRNILERQENTNKELFVPKVAKKLMDAVIKEFVNQTVQDCKSDSVVQSEADKNQVNTLQLLDYDSDSLERILSKKDDEGLRTPSDYGDVLEKSNISVEKQSEINDTLEEAVKSCETAKINEPTADQEKQSKEALEDHEYEVISLSPENKNNKFILPEILSRRKGYSLVSKVYVNDSYSFSSTSSLPSNHSSSVTNEPKIKYGTENPGQLTIEVEDSPVNYEKSYDSDNFEPDTLDRKPSCLLYTSRCV